MHNKVKFSSKLAIHGGEPVRKEFLPYGKQTISEGDISAVSEVLRSDWLTTGPQISKFEEEFAQFTGARFAVAIANGTAALHAAYFAAGIEADDEIVTTGMTFAATANAALYLGATPIFVDIDRSTGCIDPENVLEKISPKTKAIVAVDYYGHPCEADRLREIANEAGVKLIIDAAHSLGAEYKSRKVGTLGDLSTFSFHPVKSITTGEGGMIVTDDPDMYSKLSMFRTHGITKQVDCFEYSSEGPWYHEMQCLGYNYRITDFQAALGIEQLKRLPNFIERRREIAKKYIAALASFKHIKALKEKKHCRSAYHLFPVLIAKEPRSEYRRLVFEALQKENIGVQVHYIPVYQHPYYKKQDKYQHGINCPETDWFYAGQISLPIFPSMTDEDINDVIEALRKVEQGILC